MEPLRVSRAWAREHCEAPGLEWAPIQQGLEPPAAWVVQAARTAGLATLGFFLAMLWESSFLPQQQEEAPSAESLRTVSVALHLPAPVPRTAPGPSPSGIGHRRGTDSIDPDVKKAGLEHRLPGTPLDAMQDAEANLRAGSAGRVFDNLDLTLPEVPGGTGWARGFGRDATRGGFKADGMPVKPRFDHQLVVLHQQPAHMSGPFSEEERTVPVVVLILIGEDGVPLSAQALSGPERFQPIAEAAALKWRFEPLGWHGLQAPYRLRINFIPHETRRTR